MGVLALSSVCTISRSCSPCALDRAPWSAGLDEHDFLQSISFGRGGKGHYVYGHTQQVRFEVKFRYRAVSEHAVELRDFVEIDREGRKRRLRWPPQTIEHRIDRGRFCFEGDDARCYRCRMLLGASILPGSYDDYYACPEE